jgi:hypothetical protein
VYVFVKIILGDKMLYFRNKLDKNKYSTYQLNKSIEIKELLKVDNGLYSDVEFVNPLEIIIKKYPNAVFTLDSAFYYDLTDVIPDYFYDRLCRILHNLLYKDSNDMLKLV